MTWMNRFRLLAGVLGVFVLVGSLTIVFNQRQNRITSVAGEVTADVYIVGADYAGTVTAQFVDEGQEVEQGEPLFEIQSLQLKAALADGLKVTDTDAYKIARKTGTIAYYAVTAGEVTQLNARVGNSVPTGAGLATITSTGDRFVTADFQLLPRDYARVTPGLPARIVLPDGEIIEGRVDSTAVEPGETGTITKLKVTSDGLDSGTAPTNPGAPVTVLVDLVDDGPLAGVSDMLDDFLTKIGLR